MMTITRTGTCTLHDDSNQDTDIDSHRWFILTPIIRAGSPDIYVHGVSNVHKLNLESEDTHPSGSAPVQVGLSPANVIALNLFLSDTSFHSNLLPV